ncbi:helix-turn-helix domain-containing protein [Deinococcus planocerae]|uniref:helix-turn-helix domain-containing protein n=1 Tax=Deinococcus planocerae TaxID=1737569 RepID=UPI000C7E9CF5|nr:helix-turn-helix domain-containing protein [Deinococcus planocerae]
MTPKPQALLTVTEVARLLHVSDDTVRRQIREGDLEAIQIGTTPTGRPRYRVPKAAVDARLGRRVPVATPSLDRLREVFSVLSDEEREELIERAIEWARSQRTDEPDDRPRLPEPTREEIVRKFGRRLLTRKRAG